MGLCMASARVVRVYVYSRLYSLGGQDLAGLNKRGLFWALRWHLGRRWRKEKERTNFFEERRYLGGIYIYATEEVV